MKKCISLLLLAAALLPLPGEERPIPDSKAWRGKSKSAAVSRSEVRQFKPEWRHNTVVAGNKKVEFCDNGHIRIWSSGNPVLSVYPYFWIKTPDRKNHWLAPKSEGFKITLGRDGNTLLTTGTLTLEGQTWQTYTLKAELTPEGLIRITLNWQKPDPKTNWTFIPSIYMSASYDHFGGSLLKINQDSLTLPAAYDPKAEKKLGAFWKGRDFRFTFLANRPADTFSILGSKANNIPGLWVTRNQLYHNLTFQICTSTKKSGAQFDIDIRTGIREVNSDPAAVRAGIDFKQLENLEMPDRAGRNLFVNGSFERGIAGWMIGIRTHGMMYGKEKWEDPCFQLDDKVAKFGTSSLRIRTKFPLRFGGDYTAYWHQGNLCGPYTVIEPGTYTLSWYAKGDNPEHQVLNLFATNFVKGSSVFARPGTLKQCKLSSDWQRYSVTFKVDQVDCFNIKVNAASSDKQGSVWVDGIQLEKGTKATAFEAPAAEGRLFTADPQNFIDSSKSDVIGAKLRVVAAPNAKGKVRISLKNFFAEKLFEREYDYAADASGKAEIGLPFTVGSIGKGLFVLRAEYHPEKGGSCYEHHRFTVLDCIPGKFKHRRIFTENYECWHRSERFYSLLDRFQKIGYGSMAQNGNQARGKEVMDLYRKHNIDLITFYPTLKVRSSEKIPGPRKKGYSLVIANDRRDPNVVKLLADFNQECNGQLTDEYLKRFEEASAKIAAAQPWITRWCMGSEVSLHYTPDWWADGATAEIFAKMHAKLLKAFAAGIRRGNPKAVIVQGGPANMAPSSGIAEVDLLLKYTNKEGVRFDLIGFHPYRYSPESPDLDSDTKLALEMIKRHGYGRETKLAWDEMMNWGPYELPPFGTQCSTWGGPPRTWWMSSLSYDMGWTEKKSAAWRVRTWLVALKYGDRIDSCCSGNTNNFNLDIDLTPFASQITPNTLANLLGNSTFLEDVRFAPYLRTYIFDDGSGRPVAAVWCHQEQVDSGAADAPHVQADFGGILEGVFDMMNTRRKFTPGRMTFPVNSYPLFFRGKKGTAKAMIEAWRKAVVVSGKNMSPLQATAKPVSAGKYGVTLKNFVSLPIEGTMNGAPFRAEPSGFCTKEFAFPQPLTKNAIVANELPLTVTTKACVTYKYDLSFDGLIAARIPAGDKLEKVNWSRIPAIPFTKCLGAKKTSGAFRLGWNQAGLFLEVAVKDSKFVHREFADSFSRYSNDCVQIYFDTLANARSRQFKGYDEDDYEYMLQPDSKGTSCRTFLVRGVEQQLGLATQAPRDRSYIDDIPSTFTRTDDGYVYRVFFPAKYLLPIRLEKGYVFGFGLYVPNCDDDSVKGEKRVTGALTIAADGKGCYFRPKLWPAVLLSE